MMLDNITNSRKGLHHIIHTLWVKQYRHIYFDADLLLVLYVSTCAFCGWLRENGQNSMKNIAIHLDFFIYFNDFEK